MADDPNPNNPDTTTTAAAATQPAATGAPAITQADLDAAVKRATDAAWAEARRTFEARASKQSGQQPQPAQNNPAPAAPAAGTAPAVTIDSDALNDALAEFPFDREQRGEIRTAARRENPPDMDAFVTKWARLFGKQKGGAQQPNPNGNGNGAPANGSPAPAQPPVASAAPVTSRGTPPASSGPTDDTPILSMSIPDREALRAKIGDVAYAERHLKELARHNVRIRPRHIV